VRRTREQASEARRERAAEGCSAGAQRRGRRASRRRAADQAAVRPRADVGAAQFEEGRPATVKPGRSGPRQRGTLLDIASGPRHGTQMPANREIPGWNCVRAVIGVAGAVVLLAGCGAQSRVASRTSVSPEEARKLVRSLRPKCDKPGHVLIRYASPVVHGKGSESWWCVEPARSHRVISRGLRCPARTRLEIDFARHTATCRARV
jgi:hypothetical protein